MRHKQRSLVFIFTVLTISSIIIFLLLSLWFGWRYYVERVESIQFRLESQTERVSRSFSDAIDYTSYILERVNNQVRVNPTNLTYVNRVLGSFKVDDKLTSEVLALSLFSWVDERFQVLVNSEKGILPKPKDLSRREYVPLTRQYPHRIQLGAPVAGINNARWVIPMGMGTLDDEGRYIGTTVVGLDIARLMRQWQSLLTMPGLSFALFDMDLNLIVDSQQNKFPPVAQLLPKLDKIDVSKAPYGLLQKASFLSDKESFVFYKKTKYPYIILISYDKHLSDAEIQGALFSYLAEFAAIGFFILLFLLCVRRYILAPVVALSTVTDKISKGETVLEVPHADTLEMATLASQIKKVANYTENLRNARKELELAHRQVKLTNESLEKRVAERTRVLEEALEAKSIFLRNMSHEVRTPIQGMVAISGSLSDDWEYLSEGERVERARQCAQGGKRLLSLVTNLLDLSKMDMGRMNFDMKPGNDLSLIVREMIEECRMLLIDENIMLVFNEPSTPAIATFDALRITQVVRNLYANAIKFTKKGTITASLMLKEDLSTDMPYWELSIMDEGVGIPENELESIFEIFAESSRTRTMAGGTGLGLSLARQIIRAHHGKIWAGHNPSGKGAVFTFTLPRWQPGEEHVEPISAPEPPALPILPAKMRVLAIDDEPMCLMSISLYLTRLGYEVIEMPGGVEGIAYLQNDPLAVDIILLDLMMPDMYGLDVLKEIKQIPKVKNIPVILQTGSPEQEELNKGLQMGATAVILKPYQREELLRVVGGALQQQAAVS